MIYVQYKSQQSVNKTLVIQPVQFLYTNDINSIDNFCINKLPLKNLIKTRQCKTKQNKEKKKILLLEKPFSIFFSDWLSCCNPKRDS